MVVEGCQVKQTKSNKTKIKETKINSKQKLNNNNNKLIN
jgi:hypothetical protein